MGKRTTLLPHARGPSEREIAASRQLVSLLEASGAHVRTVFWCRPRAWERTVLLVATDLYDRLGPAGAYDVVHVELEHSGMLQDLDVLRIWVVSDKDPMVPAMFAVMSKARQPDQQAAAAAVQTHVDLIPVEVARAWNKERDTHATAAVRAHGHTVA